MNCQSTVAGNGVASADAAYDTMADHCTVGQERQGKEETTGDVLIAGLVDMCNCSYFCHQVVGCQLPVASCLTWFVSATFVPVALFMIEWNEWTIWVTLQCVEVPQQQQVQQQLGLTTVWQKALQSSIASGYWTFPTARGVFFSKCLHCICKWIDGNAVFWSNLIKVQQSVMWFSDWQS